MAYSPSEVCGIARGIRRIDNLDALIRSIGHVNGLNGNVLASILDSSYSREVLSALKVKGALANARTSSPARQPAFSSASSTPIR